MKTILITFFFIYTSTSSAKEMWWFNQEKQQCIDPKTVNLTPKQVHQMTKKASITCIELPSESKITLSCGRPDAPDQTVFFVYWFKKEDCIKNNIKQI